MAIFSGMGALYGYSADGQGHGKAWTLAKAERMAAAS